MRERHWLKIQLLDMTGEQVTAEWVYSSWVTALVRVGRAQDNDVIIADRYVSRYHAEIAFESGRWTLACVGRHGILRAGVRVDGPCAMEVGSHDFQIPGTSVTLRALVYDDSLAAAVEDPEMTTMVAPLTAPEIVFRVDRNDIQRAVEEIEEGDFFQSLHSARRRFVR